jgi:hypothetical protein
MKRYLVAIIIALFLCGCITDYKNPTQPGLDFNRVSRLSELEGVYKNHGDWEGSGTLAYIIWGDRRHNQKPPVVDFQAIEYIEVSSSDNSLTLKAIQNGCSIYEKTYVLGQDFKIGDGEIIIHREFHLLARGSGDVVLGPSYDEFTLGLDTAREGKFRSSESLAGLVFLLIPYATSDTRDVRFERLSDKPQGFKTCGSH